MNGTIVDADLRLMLRDQFLRVIGTVERLAVAVVARAGMVAADDEMRAAEIAPDERMPQRLARTRHAHGERQQAQPRRAFCG